MESPLSIPMIKMWLVNAAIAHGRRLVKVTSLNGVLGLMQLDYFVKLLTQSGDFVIDCLWAFEESARSLNMYYDRHSFLAISLHVTKDCDGANRKIWRYIDGNTQVWEPKICRRGFWEQNQTVGEPD